MSPGANPGGTGSRGPEHQALARELPGSWPCPAPGPARTLTERQGHSPAGDCSPGEPPGTPVGDCPMPSLRPGVNLLIQTCPGMGYLATLISISGIK